MASNEQAYGESYNQAQTDGVLDQGATGLSNMISDVLLGGGCTEHQSHKAGYEDGLSDRYSPNKND